MKPSIILSHPQMGENIGAAARVMANFGLVDLRIVAPRDGWPNEKAVEMAANASALVENAKIFKTLEEAAADLNFLYALTARNREMDKKVIAPREITLLEKTGFVFGPERTGLSNEEISLCDEIISIPVDSNFKSVNLAQSVAIIAYEISTIDHVTEQPRNQATKEELIALFTHLENELDERGFFQEATKKTGMVANIRAFLTRAQLSGQELRTLRGIIRYLAQKSP